MTIRKFSSVPTLLAGALTLLFSGQAPAQGLAVYAPIAPEYRLGDFRYNAPREDGWRQVASNPGMFILVYAESLPPDQILTRLTIIAETHAIEVEQRELVEGGQWLAKQSFGQQSGEREGRIVAYSPISPVGDNDVYKYTLVSTREDEKDFFETFYLKLAADKSSYWIAKFATSESDYQEQVYLRQFENSLSSLRIEGLRPTEDEQADVSEGDEKEIAGEKNEADDSESEAADERSD